MALTRRVFLASAGATCFGAAAETAALHAAAPRMESRHLGGDEYDPNLMVFLSDIHQHDNTVRWKNGPTQANLVLPQLVKEILTLRPLPAHAVVFGDFSASCGWIEDFRLAAAALKPLSDAGIALTFGMGNHDNRQSFMQVFPAYKKRCLVPGRIVSKVSTPNADLILLDTLKSRDGEDWAEPTNKGSHVEGAIDATQRNWLRETLAAATRPTFVGAHHDAREVGIVKEIVTTPTVFGYIFGHEHVWDEGFLHYGYSDSRTVQTATLPSGGFWGDIGYALFRTFENRAELTVRQTDFYFNRRWQDKPRPKNWTERVKMHDGRKVTFWYDKPGNFYG